MRIFFQRTLLIVLATALPLVAQEMKPNKDPVPSPSELRAQRGQDRPQGQAPEARTPSPSDLAVERPRSDGDRHTSGMPDPRSAAAGSTIPAAPSPSEMANPAPGR